MIDAIVAFVNRDRFLMKNGWLISSSWYLEYSRLYPILPFWYGQLRGVLNLIFLVFQKMFHINFMESEQGMSCLIWRWVRLDFSNRKVCVSRFVEVTVTWRGSETIAIQVLVSSLPWKLKNSDNFQEHSFYSLKVALHRRHLSVWGKRIIPNVVYVAGLVFYTNLRLLF